MNQGDYVRYTAAYLRDHPEKHEVLKLARYLGRVESIYEGTRVVSGFYEGTGLRAMEVSWPGTRRPNQLVSPTILEVVQEARQR